MNAVTYEVEHPAAASGVLIPKEHFRLRKEELFGPLVSDGPPRVSDLLHLAASIYAIDRLVRRNYQSSFRGPARVIRVRAVVADPTFWMEHTDLLRDILFVLSGDQWKFHFSQGIVPQQQQSFLEAKDTVCLYSGGLDSLAGLAHRLQSGLKQVTSVTMLHVGRQKARVRQHINALNKHYGSGVFPVLVPMALVRPPRLCEQELSQRCRGLIFAALGIGAAFATGAETIEVYENGVGALNVPLMAGMTVCGRTTKGCHPRFMELMTALGKAVLEREVRFRLPFIDQTKGEILKAIRSPKFASWAQGSFSCIHTSPRVKGDPRHCGICPACIGRRQAFMAAGVPESGEGYVIDVFDPVQANALHDDDALYLKATLMQVSLLATSGHGLPSQVGHYLRSSGVAEDPEGGFCGASLLLHRYKEEWQQIVDVAEAKRVNWAKWLGKSREGAMA